MDKTLHIGKNLVIIGVPILIIGIMIILAKSPLFGQYPNKLSAGITFDLLLTVPLIYFLLIRKTRIPKTTVVPFVIVGMALCSVLIPAQNQYYLNLFKTWVFPIFEISIVSYVVYNVGKAIKQYKLNKKEKVDFFSALKNTCHEILPKGIAVLFIAEMAVFYYGFVYWKRKKLNENEFSYHKESGTISLLIAIIFIVAIETVVLHILLAKWNVIAAWILTFLSIYSGIQLFGFLKSMTKTPISIQNNKLFLRYGIMNETIIDLMNIDSIEITSKEIELNKETRHLSFLGNLESPNVIIRLKEENTLVGLYGSVRKYRNLALHIDKKNEFKCQINKALQRVV